MDQQIAEHRICADVDRCYLLTAEVADAHGYALEYMGDLDPVSLGFARMVCDIRPDGPFGERVGYLEFLEAEDGSTLLLVYEVLPAEGFQEAFQVPQDALRLDPELVRAVAAAVLERLGSLGLLR